MSVSVQMMLVFPYPISPSMLVPDNKVAYLLDSVLIYVFSNNVYIAAVLIAYSIPVAIL